MRSEGLQRTVYAISWVPALIATVVSTLVVAIRHDPADVFPLQLSALLLSTAAAFALDDPAFDILSASPTSLRRRRLMRIAVVLAPIALVWTGQVVVRGTVGVEETLTLIAMFAGLLALSFGISGIAGRRSSGQGGRIAAATVLALIVVSTLIDPRWRPLPFGDVPGGWSALQARWGVATVAGTMLLIASSRDLAHPAYGQRRKRDHR